MKIIIGAMVLRCMRGVKSRNGHFLARFFDNNRKLQKNIYSFFGPFILLEINNRQYLLFWKRKLNILFFFVSVILEKAAKYIILFRVGSK